jgi:hypothetical protein
MTQEQWDAIKANEELAKKQRLAGPQFGHGRKGRKARKQWLEQQGIY